MKVKTFYKYSYSPYTKSGGRFLGLRLFAAQSVKNADGSHVHARTRGLCAPPCPGAAADLGAGYGESLLSSGLGAGGHPVVLRVSGGGRRSLDLLRGGDPAQPLEHAALGGGDAVGGGGGRSVGGGHFKFSTQASQRRGGGCLPGGLFLLGWSWPLEDARVLEDRALFVAVFIYVRVPGNFARLRLDFALQLSVQTTEHAGGLQQKTLDTLADVLEAPRPPQDARPTSALFVVSAFDSAPSRSNTDVRFKPFFFFKKENTTNRK